jgi:transcriptional regulator with XRE-family HTH domain
MFDDSTTAMSAKNRGTNQLPFGKKLRAVMNERGLTLKQVAQIADVGVSVVQDWVSGANPHDLISVNRLAKGLGIPFSELVLGEREVPRNFEIGELFTEDRVFSGICKVEITRLSPKGKKE